MALTSNTGDTGPTGHHGYDFVVVVGWAELVNKRPVK